MTESNPELQYAVDRLTKPWTDVITPIEPGDGYQTVEYQPLLTMLQAAVRSSLGRTASGPGSSMDRAVIDLRAFDMLERVDGAVRAWCSELGIAHRGELRDLLSVLAEKAGALWATSNITETNYLGVTSMIIRWPDEIWGLFNPPVRKELLAPCPECGQRHFFTVDGDRQSALVAQYWQGKTPEAECQRCGARWVGDKRLLELGFSIRANVDEDELRAMGVI